MALLLPRNPLAYPGTAPRFNPAHPAALGTQPGVFGFSAVPIGTNFFDLASGQTGTITGTCPAIVTGNLGRAISFPNNGAYISMAQSTIGNVNNSTFAVILQFTSVAAVQSFIAVGTGPIGFYYAGDNGLCWFQGSASESNITLVANVPYFIAISAQSSFITGVGNFVVRNLVTGQVQTATAAVGSFGSTTVRIGNGNSTSQPALASIAAAMYSPAFLSIPQLREWAKAPWDFWYPPAAKQIVAGAVGLKAPVTTNQTVTISGSSTLSAVKQAGKIPAWTTTSALSAVKAAGKALSWTTTSALSAVKSAGKVLSWTTTSALSAAAAKVKVATVAIAGSSAVSVLKTAGKIPAIAGSSAVSLVKQIGKIPAWTTTSAVTANGSAPLRHLIVAISTIGSLGVIKAIRTTVGGAINRITENGNLRFTEDGNQRVVEGAGTIPSTSAVSVVKQINKKIAALTTSLLAVIFGRSGSVTITIASTSVLRMTRAVNKGIAFVTASAVSTATTAGATATQVIAITSASAVSVFKQVNKIIAIASFSTVSLGSSFSKLVRKRVKIAGHSAIHVIKAVHKHRRWTTTSMVVVNAIKVKIVIITINCISTVMLTLHLIRQVLILISTTSRVTVFAAKIIFHLVSKGRTTITLVGTAMRVLLYGIRAAAPLSGRRYQLELTGMSREQDGGPFHYGETWLIGGLAQDETGDVLDLTGATVQFRFVTLNPNAIVLDLATPSNGSITNPTAGTYLFTITPAQQAAAGMTLNAYNYEVRVLLNDGTTATLNTGEITILPSKFVNFP